MFQIRDDVVLCKIFLLCMCTSNFKVNYLTCIIKIKFFNCAYVLNNIFKIITFIVNTGNAV